MRGTSINQIAFILLALGLMLAGSCTAPTANLGLDASTPSREASLIGPGSGAQLLNGSVASRPAVVTLNEILNPPLQGVRVNSNVILDRVRFHLADGTKFDFDGLLARS